MTTLLIILAHPHTDDFSWSLATVEEFKKSYQESHPLDKIIIRDLFQKRSQLLIMKLLLLGNVINMLLIH